MTSVFEYFVNIDKKNDDVWYPTSYSWNLVNLALNLRVEGLRVLDVGCGAGNIAMAMAEKGANVFASDICEIAVNETKMNAKNLGLPVTVEQSDGLDLWIDKGMSFDVIICNPPCFHVLEEMNENSCCFKFNSYLMKSVLNKYRSTLRDSGHFISVTSGERNFSFIRNEINKTPSIENSKFPFCNKKKVSTNIYSERHKENLISSGLMSRSKSVSYWNAHYFGIIGM